MSKVVVVLSLMFLFSCSNETNQNNTPQETIEIKTELNQDTTKVVTPISYKKADIQTLNTPYTDSTNFDNYNSKKLLSESDIDSLQLKQVQDQLGYYDSIFYNYQLNLSTNFKTNVFLFLSENELKSVLVNYGVDGNSIDFIEVAYDEIAEGWSTTTSEIYTDKIIVTDVLWLDEKQETIKEYIILENGKIKIN